ncbi:MAG: threonine/serine exporter family protein [Muribaculaceae bacterium]|nr:threonine/serine exporter family protein [Muribaculaceae bacterium]
MEKLHEYLDFMSEYATYLLGSGVHTSRVVRNVRRIGDALNVEVEMNPTLASITISVTDKSNGDSVTRVVAVPALPISFERNSDLSSLSWDAVDRKMTFEEIREDFRRKISKPRIDPIFTLLIVAIANASFCRLFGGDWVAMGIVFTSTLVGFSTKMQLQRNKLNHFLILIVSAFFASICASAALQFDCTAQVAIATSPLFLVPGVPLINGFIDMAEGYVLIGLSRLINASLMIACIAIGLAATLTIVSNSINLL